MDREEWKSLCLLGKHLLLSADCPSHLPVSVFGRAGSACFVRPPGPPASLCRTHALLWLPGSGYLAKKGRSGVCSEKGGQCFLTLCSVAFNSARLTWELEKHLQFIRTTHKHIVGVAVQEHTRITLDSYGANLTILRAVFDFLKSWGSPCSPVTTTAEPLILSPLIVFQ